MRPSAHLAVFLSALVSLGCLTDSRVHKTDSTDGRAESLQIQLLSATLRLPVSAAIPPEFFRQLFPEFSSPNSWGDVS